MSNVSPSQGYSTVAQPIAVAAGMVSLPGPFDIVGG